MFVRKCVRIRATLKRIYNSAVNAPCVEAHDAPATKREDEREDVLKAVESFPSTLQNSERERKRGREEEGAQQHRQHISSRAVL